VSWYAKNPSEAGNNSILSTFRPIKFSNDRVFVIHTAINKQIKVLISPTGFPPFDATQNTFAPKKEFLKSQYISWNVSSTIAFTLFPNLQYNWFPKKAICFFEGGTKCATIPDNLPRFIPFFF
jgi:hypothetical protein